MQDKHPAQPPSASWSLTANALEILRCPHDGAELSMDGSGMRCSVDPSHYYRVVRSIPRFVPDDDYVDSFSYEWTIHNQTQLDTYTGSKASANQFLAKTGLRKEDIEGKLILDAGVGAGRYADVMLSLGARVVGMDLSFAVDSAWQNLGSTGRFSVLQADISQPPFSPECFDYIVSIGVLHHTPDTRAHFEKLLPYLKPGGEIAIWVYPNAGDFATRAQWIPFVSRIPKKMFYRWCRWFVPLMHRIKGSPVQKYIAKVFPYSDQGLGMENDILDTFDGYSPTYHGVHTPREVKEWFLEAGLVNVHYPGNWDTSVRGRKPARKQ